jgi:uncharacterized integral membrane protein
VDFLNSKIPIVLTLLVVLLAILAVGALAVVNANPLSTTTPTASYFPFIIMATAVLALAIVGAVLAMKHGLIKIREIKTGNTPLAGPLTALPYCFCRYCGTEIRASGQFCDKCGRDLT